MDIESLSKNYSKEHIYRIYEAVSENYKKYKQITRKQCLLKIQEAYQDKNILKAFITNHEFELLRKVYKEKRVIKTFVYEELINRFILVDDNMAFIKINPEFEEIISELLESKIERIGYDRYDEIIIGVVNYFGVISYEELFEFIRIYAGEYDEETMFDHISSSPIINYLFLCPEEYVICRYDLFEDYAQIMMNRRNLDHHVLLPELKELISYGHYGLNINEPCVQEFFEILFPMYYYQQCNLIYNMMKDAHLRESFDMMKHYLINVLEFNDYQIDVFEKAYETLPCASNYGIPLKLMKLNSDDSTELESVIQENAHLSEHDADIFYECYLSLLEYINDKYQVCPHIKKIVGVPIDPSDVVEIRKVLLSHFDDIDEFIHLNQVYFNEDEIQIIKNFKYMKFAHYVVVKYEKDYTLFMDGEVFYAVKGVRSNISEMLANVQLPALVDALLLPFNDSIVVDGVIQSYPIQLGDGYNHIILENLKKEKIKKQLVQYN